jgi:hypothetical protein
MSISRIGAEAASLVCRVESRRCPVSEARMAISAVSWSRISPSNTISGSWRRTERRARAKVKPIAGFIWNWVMPAIRDSTGSSRVRIFFSGV